MKSLISLILLFAALPALAEVAIEKLTWAGVKLVHDDTTVFIDVVGSDIWNGNPPGALVPVSAETSRRYALLTHAHNDHFDPESLHAVLGDRGYVIVPEAEASYIASRGFRVIPAVMWTPVARGGFLFTAVPAVDGLGETQVSWVITVDNKRYFHGGDTLWHGYWDIIGRQFGPFDLVFLPINGARPLREPMPDSPASLTPTQALDAAILLRAGSLVPIHYGLDDPPYYTEVPDALDKTVSAAKGKGITVYPLQPGEGLSR